MDVEGGIKISKKELIILAIIGVLLLSLFFGLGYIAGRDFTKTPIIIEKNSN